MSHRSEIAKNLASAFQATVVTIAIIVGGIWTLITFNLLDLPRLRQELFRQAQVDIVIDAHHEARDGRNLIAATVSISNQGRRNALLDYRDTTTFSVRKIGLDGEEAMRVLNSQDNYRVLRSGETVRYLFVAEADGPGLYIASYRVPLSKTEEEEHWKVVREENERNDAGIAVEQGRVFWVGSTFVKVVDDAADD